MASVSKLIISQSNYVYILDIEQIIFCQADDGYTNIFMNDDSKFLFVKSLTKVASEDLNSDCFMRVHQSYLINKNFIRLIDKKNKRIQLINQQLIPFTINLKKLILLINGKKLI